MSTGSAGSTGNPSSTGARTRARSGSSTRSSTGSSSGSSIGGTRRLTVAQALVRFLAVQHTERDGTGHRLIEGVFGIFGHGNVAGLGEALLGLELQDPALLPYRQARNEQAM